MNTIPQLYGSMVFNDHIMKEKLPKEIYRSLHRTIETGCHFDLDVANAVASAMKEWAISLGAFILWCGWFGFNGASSLSLTGDDKILEVGNVFVNTNLAAAAAAVVVMVVTWIRFKKPDVSMTLNGALAGLVAITAGCDLVSPLGAFLIGIVAAFAVMFGIEFVDKVLKIDDPVGAVGVHLGCGAVGTILTGLFATESGLFYGGGFQFLGVQCLGVLAVTAWVSLTVIPLFFLLKKTIGLRVHAHEELVGLDKFEHGIESSYADFMPSSLVTEAEGTGLAATAGTPSAPAPATPSTSLGTSAVKSPSATANSSERKFTKVVVVTRSERLGVLTTALESIGITGMTVCNVHGFGIQKGNTEYYRGVPLESKLLPKVQVEIVVSKIPVQNVVDAIKSALYTGKFGDGKIFVYDVENVVRVRTGESGYAALQDE